MIHYLDCNATTPIDPEVAQIVRKYMEEEFGNSGSRTHNYGLNAKLVIEESRNHISSLVDSAPEEVIFTSGATESNNLAILGLREYLLSEKKNHIITTSIEHKAVLEPIKELEKYGIQVSFVKPTSGGYITTESIQNLIQDNTGLISVMHVNNETGVINPIEEIALALNDDIYFHVDAAQGFGKDLSTLKNNRVDLISISGHKIHAPKGVGALITRRRNYKRPPLNPIIYGGGQEKGLRAGTLPTALIAGLGKASQIMEKRNNDWKELCINNRSQALSAFKGLDFELNGDPEKCLPNVLNISFNNINSEVAILVLKDLVAISNGSACTSSSYELSHVLKGMGFNEKRINSAIRMSWSHLTKDIPWVEIAQRLKELQ